jgi:hypothetical protein
MSALGPDQLTNWYFADRVSRAQIGFVLQFAIEGQIRQISGPGLSTFNGAASPTRPQPSSFSGAAFS